jgi:DNA polymerase III delta prime subunit
MTEEQKKWFDKLYIKRDNTATTLMDDFAISNIWNSVVEKYSDQAHFIYELLQNANDAKATKSSFQLTQNGLYFKHNGNKNFWVSNPETEREDQQNNNLGDINAITAVAQSNKKDQSTIGKFGVGFKAVFQYTETPHIYDPTFQFKINKFIVPIRLENDLSDRQKNETVFYFPFDKQEADENGNLKMSPEKAYLDILEKLKSLIYPTLFLSSLEEVKWLTEKETGEYTKKITKRTQEGNISCEKIELNQQIGLQQTKDKLFLFSRLTEEYGLNYSIGFFLDEKNKLTPKEFTAFCFFPTKETTNLNFILHAPFLLTDSREGIHRSKEHNSNMVDLLAQLSSDSLLILKKLNLIDDNIINIIPYKEKDFYVQDSWGNLNRKNPKFFAPFYTAIKEKFETEELLPTIDNHIESQNAYWAQDNPVLNLFSDEQLAMLIDDEDAKWVFRNLVRNQTGKDDELREYIEGCTANWYEMNDLLKSFDSNFIENQSNEWLHKLYEYLSKNNSYWGDVKTKPIFLNKERKAVPAFEKKGKDFHEILFLPSENLNSITKTIFPELLKNEKTKEFIESFGIKQPSLKDEIYNHILPIYEEDGDIDTESHFKLFFKYWKTEGRPEEFLELLKDKEFISYKTKEDEVTYRGIANEIYYPTENLQNYFVTKPNTKFVDLDDYYSFITDEKDKVLLKDFLIKLGVSELPRILNKEITDWNERNKIKSHLGDSLITGTAGYSGQGTFDKIIDGCKEIITNIDTDKSLQLWEILGKLRISKLEGVHKYFYYSQQYQYFVSTTLKLLKTSKWLLSINDELVAPSEILLDELSELYESNTDLEHLLGFKPTIVLSQAERIAQKFDNEEDAEFAKKLLENYKARQNSSLSTDDNSNDLEEDELPKSSKISRIIRNLEDLQNEFPTNQKENQNQNSENKPEINFDEDEEFAKGIEELKKQLEIKKSRVDLAESINNSVKYSFDWFIAYLQLLTTYGEKQDTQKQKSISFQEIKPYKADNKYFLLCGASSYISPEIENADDFKVSLVFGNGKREHITVEGVSKKGQDLLIYCRESLSSNTISRLTTIFKVEINFTPVIDLLDRLERAFENRNYIDEWENIEEAMPSLNYIYGPPGTGKTTTLCNNINEKLTSNPKAKFLVLTPTNKASDVVCKKLQDINPNIYAVRLSRPTDPELEENQIYRDTLDDEDMQNIDVVASTIHRLPYFDIQEIGLMFQYDWDYVIFDESSMTGLHYITFAIMALFKTNPNTNFIVAGDPKQIPPVVEIDEKELENFDFQDENIYKMMKLVSFNPEEQIIRETDSIVNLATQYRSVPNIGQLFSELSYSCLLKHDRATNRTEAKPLPENFRNLISSNVTFIDIPLNQDNSIYRVNKLFYSSYHTYCAILVSEIIKYFDVTNKDELWTIGLIAPYKAQAMLLNKLITSYGISANVKVISDTVHGFQGDECDIVFFVCNPNNYFFSNHEKALLSKEYIYNVAISRAKDYLIVLHPYTAIPNNKFINKIALSYKNNFGNTKILNANEIENMLFNESNYIENNSYVSGHDNVNVFGLSEMKYFIKANDTAIDIQLRELKEYNTNGLTVESKNVNQNGGLKIVGKIDLSKFEKHKK